ncbi:MAG: hypothetical protein HGA85_03190 [Nanoarchaeota archaeon]|nr:hypothetical protein [Nanoarchaeota archaeon]
MTNNTTLYDKLSLLKEFEDYILKDKGHGLPASIFSYELSPLESSVKFLIENKGMGFSEAGKILNRDRRVIWTTYKRASGKMPGPFKISSAIIIPASILGSEENTVAEQLVVYMHEILGMKLAQIASVTGRSMRTLQTLYRRALHRRGEK